MTSERYDQLWCWRTIARGPVVRRVSSLSARTASWALNQDVTAADLFVSNATIARGFLFLKPLQIFLTALCLAFFAISSHAQEGGSNFRRIDVSGRLSLDVPSHWRSISESGRKDLATAAEAAMGAAGLPYERDHRNAMSIVAVPDAEAANIRVSFVDNIDVSQAELRVGLANPTDRAEMEQAMREQCQKLGKLLPQINLALVDCKPVRYESIGGFLAIVQEYRRTANAGPSPIVVTQYHVVIGRDKILVGLAYRESQAVLYRPILERVKRSINIVR